jgi:hypothetical protein
VVAGLDFLFVAGAAGVGIDASFVLVPLLLVPLAIALALFVAGDRVLVLALASAAAIGYAGLGVWNYFRAADFERVNPGSVEVSGGAASVTFVLLTLAVGAWTLGAARLIHRTGRP